MLNELHHVFHLARGEYRGEGLPHIFPLLPSQARQLFAPQLICFAATEELLVVGWIYSVHKMIKILDLDQPQNIWVIDTNKWFSKHEVSKILLIFELLVLFIGLNIYVTTKEEVK